MLIFFSLFKDNTKAEQINHWNEERRKEKILWNFLLQRRKELCHKHYCGCSFYFFLLTTSVINDSHYVTCIKNAAKN